MIGNDNIQALIRLPKVIVSKSPARGYREENGSRRCDLELQTSNGSGQVFPVFIRQHIRFGQNFSIGLRYSANQGKPATVTLIRYNGFHGETSRAPDGHYAQPHIHYTPGDEIASGNTHPQENLRQVTDRYSTFDEALRAFFADTATLNYSDYFPELTQPRLINGY